VGWLCGRPHREPGFSSRRTESKPPFLVDGLKSVLRCFASRYFRFRQAYANSPIIPLASNISVDGSGSALTVISM
jgi:hypothetical protein